MPDNLPTWGQAVASLQPKLPTWDQAVAGEQPPPPMLDVGMSAGVPMGPEFNEAIANSPIGRIMSAFGHGAAEAAAGPDFGDEFNGWAKKAGIYNDIKDGQVSLGRTFNEMFLRPPATAIGLAGRAMRGAFGGVMGAVAQTGAEVGAPSIGREAAAMIESGAGLLGSPGTFGIPPSVIEGRSLGVIGEGEEGWASDAPATAENMAARAEATKQLTEGLPEPPEAPSAAVGAPAPPSAPPIGPQAAPPDIHAIARQIAPDTFREYDALQVRHGTFRRWIDELTTVRDNNATADLNAQIGEEQARLEGATGRRAATYRNRINDLTAQRDAALEEARKTDSPDMARIRTELQTTDYRMRDLAPDVTAAYREAQKQVPVIEEQATVPLETAEAPKVEPAEAVQPVSAPEGQAGAAPVQEVPREGAAGIPPQATGGVEGTPGVPRPPIDIATDVSQKLVAAGRPAEESDAAAALVAAHYDARAARLGTDAQSLYAEEAPGIEGAARGRKGELGRTIINDGRRTIRLMANADASTFLHETGHQWLEELISDAADDRATQSVRDDAATVRNWLGAKEGETIPTRGHEKFARGFERYMMEGVAPSPQLASVFAKFKDWLTKIYQTVSRLRAPISDDIRQVFDRMLTQQPEKPIIAPERETELALGEKHETIAAKVGEMSPQEAGLSADQIRAEADDYARMNAPSEVVDEIGARETGAGAPAGAGIDRGGNAAELQPAAAGGGAEPRAIGAGRGEVAEEVSGRAANRGGGRHGGTGEPINPNDTFGEPESPFIDKAGNIRLDLLGTPEDVNEVIHAAAGENDDFIGARRGVISDAQVMDLADALGMDVKELNRRTIGQAFNAEQVVAARKLLIQSATSVRDIMAKAASGSDADVMAYAEAKQRHLMIQEQVSGITAEAGRALRAFHQLEGAQEAQQIGEFLKDTTGRTLFQLREEAKRGAALDTPAKVSKFIHDSQKPTFGDMTLEYWINGLISGPATHTTYSIGNALLSMSKSGPETAAASGVGALRAAFGAEGPRVMLGEVPARAFAMMDGARDGIVAAWQAARTGQTTLLPGEAETMSARQMALSTLVNPRAAIPNFTVGGVPVPLGTLARLPSRGIAVIHSFFRHFNYTLEKSAEAYRTASAENLPDEAFAARVGELYDNPTPEIMQRSRVGATDLTLMGKGGELTQAISRLTNARFAGGQWLKFIDPFVHISSNIIEQAILQRTPIGVFSEEIRNNLLGKNGGVAQDMAIGRMAVGSAMGVAIGSLAAEGLINGSGPSDPKEAAIYTAVNGPPHSVRIGDTWYAIQRLGPLGMLTGIAADLYQAAHMIGKEDATVVAENLANAFTQNILDESFMRGPADLIRAVTDHDRYGAAYIRNFVSSFTPYSVGMAQIARGVDPYARQARTVMDAVKAKIPWLSETLLPRRDIWGESIPNRDALGVAGLSAIYEMRQRNDPVERELLNLKLYPAMPERKIRGVPLTDQQYDDYSRIAGRLTKMRLNALVAARGWESIPPGMRVDTIRKVISSSREAARAQIMMQGIGGPNDIVQKAIDAKKAHLTAPAQ